MTVRCLLKYFANTMDAIFKSECQLLNTQSKLRFIGLKNS